MSRRSPRTGLVGAAVALVVLAGLPALARPLHYGAVTDPALAACDDARWQGRIEEAAACYGDVLAGEGAAGVRAEAAWALGDRHAANRLFRAAAADRPGDPALLTRWGDLYADSHQDSEAMNIYREALAADDGYAYARLGAGRLLVGAFDDAANEYLEPLLSERDHPAGARLGAWLLVARMALESGSLDDAADALDEAEELVSEHGWPPLEVYALRAAIDLINGVGESRWTRASLAYNPRYGDIYAIPAHFHVIARRYRDAIDLYGQAVDIDPGLASAHEELGVNLLRDNQVSRARRHLEIAYELDPFSPVAVNTLRLLDSFSRFDLINWPETPRAGGEHPLVLRLQKEESAAIAPYAVELAQRSIAEFTAKYGYTLTEPVVIEMYPDHEDFAVRTAGMPGLGILGATFGYVIAMDSPSARSTDQFQWGTTLWHEMAHVFTLEATDHLVPRWFSEGVSVFEEWRSGPHPGPHIPMAVYNAMHEERFLPVAILDEGFLRPSYPDQVIVSYMQAGLVCQFIDRRFGPAALGEMLSAYRDGLDTEAVVETVLGLPTPRFDREFREFVKNEHGHVLRGLEDWHAARAALHEGLEAGDWDAVTAAATDFVELHPGYVEPDSGYVALARAHEARNERPAALAALETFWQKGGYDPDALKRLADWLADADRRAEAVRVLETVVLVQPLDTELHAVLGDLLLETGDAARALREFEISLAGDPHDKASAYYRVARAEAELGNTDRARSNLLAALDIAPAFRPAQRLLLELTRAEAARKTQ